MGQRLAHKGKDISIWSPARNVYFGEVRYWPRATGESPYTASSGQIAIDWTTGDAQHCDTPRSRDEFRRVELCSRVAKDAVLAAAGIDGMYSYAHWDSAKHHLILGVDRVGYERIYYTAFGESLAFASDYKALLALNDVQIAPNPDALQYAIATVSLDLSTTFALGIRKVPHYHVLKYDGRSEEVIPYWNPRARPIRLRREQAAEMLKDVLTEEIRQTLTPFAQIGLTLSGGLDSTGLLALIRHTLPDIPVNTYTIGHSNSDPEIIGARESAASFGTNHREIFFEPASIIKDLPELVWLAEEFAGREEALLQFDVERSLMHREEVVVSGLGADRVFAGMPRHKLVRMAEKLPLARRPLTELFQQTQSGKLPESLRGRLASWLLYRGQHMPPPLLRGSAGISTVDEPSSLDNFLESSIVGMNSVNYHSSIQALAPTEIFMPFLSKSTQEFSLTLPAYLKSTVFRQKIVLRDALLSVLPDEIRKRGKAIQRIRHDDQLADVLNIMADVYLSSASLSNRSLICEKYVSAIRNEGDAHGYSGDRFARLWMMLVCEIWCRIFVDNRGRPI
jgi:asparagine synthase (glutamine-hydrolysing)